MTKPSDTPTQNAPNPKSDTQKSQNLAFRIIIIAILGLALAIFNFGPWLKLIPIGGFEEAGIPSSHIWITLGITLIQLGILTLCIAYASSEHDKSGTKRALNLLMIFALVGFSIWMFYISGLFVVNPT